LINPGCCCISSIWTFDKFRACQKRWNCMKIGSYGQPISAVPL
jgi:hypothetical protein